MTLAATEAPPTPLHKLIPAIVANAGTDGIGRTKLVKLLYLIDLESYCRRGVTLTGASWIRQKKGPLPSALYRVTEELEGKEIRIEERLKGRFTEKTHVIGPTTRYDLTFVDPERSIVDDVLETYGRMPLDAILRVVYETPPMRAALAAEEEAGVELLNVSLDFSTCDADLLAETDEQETAEMGGVDDREAERLRALKGLRATWR